MSLRINHNISSMNAQRLLGATTRMQSRNLEHLSSGQKINRGADGPASLVISERMRSQISGIKQAIDNSETNISMIQTTEAALDEVSRLLVQSRQLAIHAANDGVNDNVMLEADQQEISNALATVDRIAANTQFGTKNLLDGSRGANGVANGENLEFVDAGVNTKTSPVSGYKIQITKVATRSELRGDAALTQEIINAGERITIAEGGKTLVFETKKGESVESNLNSLETKIKEVGLNVELVRNDQGIIQLRHKEFGSNYGFSAASSTAGIISKEANVTVDAVRGDDVAGSINGEEATGKGQVLTGKKGAKNVEGLQIRYTGDKINQEGEYAGTVSVYQNSLVFQIGGNAGQTTAISLKNMSTTALAQGVANKSNFRSLAEVDVRSAQGSQDTIRLLDKALESVASTRGDLGAFQKNNLESNLNYLRIAHENLTNAESVVRDADMAQEMSDFTKNQIMMQSGTAMLAQANQMPQVALALLK